MQAQRWTAPGKELELLSSQPATCLAHAPADKALVRAGQALFNTPTLLGGQAAKAGLNCAACHVNGRDNPNFLVPGISRTSGTADVTSSFFSAARHNAVFDPVSIPDLAKPGKISRDPQDKALEIFIRDLIVDEFSGAEPSTSTLQALTAYVRSIEVCPGRNAEPAPHRIDDQLLLIDSALEGAVAMPARHNDKEAALLIAAARHQLGLINERYAGRQLVPERRALLQSSRQLQAVGVAGIASWRRNFENKLVPRLRKSEKYSLYNRHLLAQQLTTSR